MKLNKKWPYFINLPLIISAIGILVMSACTPEGRDGRPTVPDFTREGASTSSEFCQAFTTVDAVSSGDTSVCRNQCASDQEPGDSNQIQQLFEDIEDSDNTQETKDFLITMIDQAQGVCFPEVITRPDEAIFVQRDFCGCLDSQADVLNDCASFCSERETQESRLFGEVTVGPDIELNPELQNLHGWCTNELEGLDDVSPSCVLELWSDSGSEPAVGLQTFPGSNRFEANISSLRYDRTYIAKIVERTSGASSDSFQIRRFPHDGTDTDTTMPLRIMPTSQYTCLDRTGECGQIIDEDELYLCARRRHYYFAANNEPPALPPDENFTICHDLSFGQNDNELFPRFELRQQHFAMWDQSDSRFVSEDGSTPRINQLIREKLLRDYGEDRDQTNVFSLFQWPNRPGSGQVNLGFILLPWIDTDSGQAYCPGVEEYNGQDNLFKVLGELIGVETEGLFIAVPQAEGSSDNTDSIESLMLIRENLLKKIWFYYKDGQHYVPTEREAGQRTIRFYWPPDFESPYQKKAYQRLFTIRGTDEISDNAVSGLQSSVRPPDKRIGCVPAVD